MVGNGSCDEVCLTPECSNDGGDCECHSGCVVGASTLCSNECMVQACDYNNYGAKDGCADSAKLRLALDYQALKHDYDAAVDWSQCLQVSAGKCTQVVATALKACSNDCNFPECNYSAGFCAPHSTSCARGSEEHCFQCVAPKLQYFDKCVAACPHGYTLNFNRCMDSSDSTTETAPDVIYVRDSPGTEGSGTESDPYGYLVLALAAAWKSYTKINLIGAKVTLTNSGTDFPSTSVELLDRDSSDPLKDKTFKKLTITSLRCYQSNLPGCSAYTTTVSVVDRIKLTISGTAVLQNLVLSGAGFFSGTVLYCPDVNSGFDDRGQLASEDATNASAKCNSNTFAYAFIRVQANAKLQITVTLIKDVDVNDFAIQQQAIILLEGGSVALQRVSFSRNTPVRTGKGAVILQTGNCSPCGSVTYQSGSVTYLNDGYEYASDGGFNPFLVIESADSVAFEDVEFAYNNVLSGDQGKSAVSALVFIESSPAITFKTCNFHNNLSKDPLIYIRSTLILAMDQLVANSNVALSFTQLHVSVASTSFLRNMGSNGLVAVIISGDLLNIEMSGCQFERNSVVSGSYVTVQNSGKITTEDSQGGTKNVKNSNTSNKKTSVYISPRSLKFSTLSFKSEKSFQSLLFINQYPNIAVSGLSITESGDTLTGSYTDVIGDYISDGTTYMTISPSFGPDQLCKAVVIVQNSSGFSLKSSTISKVTCSAGGAGLTLQSVTGTVTVDTVTAADNTGKGANGAVINTSGDLTITITSATISTCKVEVGSAFRFSGNTDLSLSDSTFSSNVGGTGGAVYLEGGGQVSIQRSSFTNNSCKSGVGGAVWYRYSTAAQLSFFLSDSTFSANQADEAGGLYITGISGNTATLPLSITRTTFATNSATSFGAAIVIDSAARVSNSAQITDCVFRDNTSLGGTVYLTLVAGSITLARCSFERNSGGFAAALQISTGAGAVVTLSGNTFTSHTGGPVILKPDSRKSSVVVSSACTFTTAADSCIYMEGGSWTDTSSTFSGCQNTAFSITSGAKVEASKSTFRSNSSRSNGGAVYMGSKSTLKCSDCTFASNAANASGGALFLEQDSAVTLSGCTFVQNTAGAQGAAIFQTSASSLSTVKNTSFRLNAAGFDGTVSSISSSLTLEGAVFNANTAAKCPGVSLLLSTLTIKSSSFASQSGSTAAFLSMSTSSTVSISDTTFEDGASSTAGAVFCVGSSVTATRCSFRRMQGDQSALLSASNEATIRFSEVTAQSLQTKALGGLLFLTESTLEIAKSTITDFAGGGVVGSQLSSVVIDGSTFRNGQADSGAALSCDSCGSVKVTASTFESLRSRSGGALYVDNSGQQRRNVTLTSSVFRGNSATVSGGAVSLVHCHLALSAVTFEGNNATNGGAIALSCDDRVTCNYTIANTTFTRNRAETQGGGVYWYPAQPSLIDIIWVENTAKYGEKVASFAVQLKSLNITTSSGRVLQSHTEVIEAPPGQTAGTTITAALMDHYGGVVSIDDYSVAELSTEDLDTASVSGVSKITAKAGVFVFDAFVIYADPNTTASVTLSTDGIPLPDQSYPADIPLTFELRDCLPGESRATKSCFVCQSGTYSFDPALPCQNCPRNAQCLGNYTLLPDSGYWRSALYSAGVLECPNKKACLGGSIGNLTGECREGYTGNLCQSCEDGFSHSSKNVCSKCPELSMNITRLALIALAAVVVISVLVLSALRSANRPAALHSIYLKILMNYLQLVLLTAEFKLNWPDEVLQLFDAQQTVGGVTEQAFSVDCFLAGNKSAADSYFRKMAFVALLPIALVAAAVGFWSAACVYKRRIEYLKRELAATIVIVFFLIHPNLVKMMFSMFSCTDIDGTAWLTVDMAIECWTPTHLRNLLTTGLPGILLWVFTVPTLCLLVLIKFRHRHDELWIKLQYGFLINGYRRKQYYWEFVVLYRKIIIICCAVFLGGSIPAQALTVQVVLLLALFLQYDTNPYTTVQLNRMELRAIMVADVTIYCGLYYLTDDLSEVSSWVFFTAIVAVNAVFLTYWLLAMFGYVLRLASLHVHCLGRVLNPSQFTLDGDIETLLELFQPQLCPYPDFPLRTTKSLYLRLLKSHLTVPVSHLPAVSRSQVIEHNQTDAESLFETRVKYSIKEEAVEGGSFSFQQDLPLEDAKVAPIPSVHP